MKSSKIHNTHVGMPRIPTGKKQVSSTILFLHIISVIQLAGKKNRAPELLNPGYLKREIQ